MLFFFAAEKRATKTAKKGCINFTLPQNLHEEKQQEQFLYFLNLYNKYTLFFPFSLIHLFAIIPSFVHFCPSPYSIALSIQLRPSQSFPPLPPLSLPSNHPSLSRWLSLNCFI